MRRARYTRRSPRTDSYHKSNSYGLPSEAHLLVMGREHGNPMPDKMSLSPGRRRRRVGTTSPNDTLCAHHEPHMAGQAEYADSRRHYHATRWTATGMTVTPEGFLDVISLEREHSRIQW